METDRPGTGAPTFEGTQVLTGPWRWTVVAMVGLGATLVVGFGGPDPLAVVLALGVPLGLAAVTLLSRVDTSVRADGVRVRFAPFHRAVREARDGGRR